MLESMVIEEADKAVQAQLFEFFNRTNNTTGLQALAALPTLDPEVDDLLSRLSSAPVRSKWMTRPGRTVDEVMANLRREKRVGVLTELIEADLDVEAYTAIAKANKSHTVALSILKAEKPNEEARAIAAGNLGKYIKQSTRGNQALAVKNAMANNPDFYENFALQISDVGGLRVALTGGHYSSATQKRLLDILEGYVDKTTASINVYTSNQSRSRPTQYWDPNAQVPLAMCRELAELTANLHADWVPDEYCVRLLAKVKSMQDAVSAVNENMDSLLTAVYDNLNSRETAATLTTMVAEIEKAVSAKDIKEALAEAKELRSAVVTTLQLALLRNDKLDFEQLSEAFNDISNRAQYGANIYSLGKTIGSDITTLPIASVVYLISQSHWAVDATTIMREREQEWVEALFAATIQGVRLQVDVTVSFLCSTYMTTDMYKQLPSRFIKNLYDKLPACARQRLGTILLDLLDGESVNAWEQFDRLSGDFNGSLEELAALVKAATT